MEGLDFSELSFADDLVVAGDAHISWLKVLVYGPSGGGKSSLMATMPDPLLVLVTEKQAEMSIKRVNPKAIIRYIEDTVVCECHGKRAERCDRKNQKNWRTEKLTAKQVLYGVLDELATKKHPFLSVALDSLTDMQQVLISDMKGGQIGKKVSLPEWGILIDQTKDLVIKLRNLNMHVGVICLSDETPDNNQRMICRPALAGKKLPGSIIQYFNLCGFQRKQRDPNAVGPASYETVFDAGDEYYTKTHPALEAVEAPLFRSWVDKVAKYAQEHGEGDMPSASAPVQQAVARRTKQDEQLARISKPEIKELFDKLDAPEGKRLITAEKYRNDDKLIEVLQKRIAEQAQEKEKKEAEARAAAAAEKAKNPSATDAPKTEPAKTPDDPKTESPKTPPAPAEKKPESASTSTEKKPTPAEKPVTASTPAGSQPAAKQPEKSA